MYLQDVLKNVETLHIEGDVRGKFSDISYDSKSCGQDSLFVAIRGINTDGHRYIPDAVARGARYIIYENSDAIPLGVTTIRVSDSRKALGLLSKNFFGDPSSRLCLIGVTGTNGKTTVTYLLESILKAARRRVGVLGTVNYRFNRKILPAPNTTPESYDMQKILRQMVDEGITHVVAEVSSHAVDLKRIDDCDFDMGIFTNLTQDHLDYHATMGNYFQAKKRFFDEVLPSGGKSSKSMIINGDDPWGRKLLTDVQRNLHLRTYGIENACDMTANAFSLSLEGIKSELHIRSQGPVAIASPLIGKFNLYNIMAASMAAFSLNVSPSAIRRGIAALRKVPGRLEKVSGEKDPCTFVDYAHTDDAIRRVLQNLLAFRKRKIITVFGCGGDRDRGKRPLMGHAAAELSDITIVTSDNPRTEDPLAIITEIEKGIHGLSIKKLPPEDLCRDTDEKGYAILPDRKTAIETAVSIAERSDIILIAGKGHENYQIIGKTRMPFDDKKIAKASLEEKQSMLTLRAYEIAEATEGSLLQGRRTDIFHAISTDSRHLEKGALFVPLVGEKYDGHNFLADAIKGGATGVLVQKDSQEKIALVNENITVILVEDTLRALGNIAHHWRKQFTIPVVAITGSSGKTTTKEMMAGIVGLKKNLIKTQGNFNNLIGAPLTLLQLRNAHDAMILELGTNRRGEIEQLTRMAEPDIALVTNIGPAHLEGLKSLDTIREEKCDLFRNMRKSGLAVINVDDEAIQTFVRSWQGKKITYGFGADNDVSAEDIRDEGWQQNTFTLRIGEERKKVRLSMPGKHNIYNALAAAASSRALGMDLQTICEGLTAFNAIPGRMEIIRLRNGAFVINDTYNANPASVREALKTLRELRKDHAGLVILGDMLELGDYASEMHENIGSLMADTGVDTIFLRGRLSKATAAGALKRNFPKDRIVFFDAPSAVIPRFRDTLKKGDWILVKGSRGMKMEETVRQIIDVFGTGMDKHMEGDL